MCPGCQQCQSASIIPLLRAISQSCLSQSVFRFHNTLLFLGSTPQPCLSVGCFLSALTPLPHRHYLLLRITSVPCLDVSPLLHGCLTLCLRRNCKVHFLILRVNPQVSGRLFFSFCFCSCFYRACLHFLGRQRAVVENTFTSNMAICIQNHIPHWASITAYLERRIVFPFELHREIVRAQVEKKFRCQTDRSAWKHTFQVHSYMFRS